MGEHNNNPNQTMKDDEASNERHHLSPCDRHTKEHEADGAAAPKKGLEPGWKSSTYKPSLSTRSTTKRIISDKEIELSFEQAAREPVKLPQYIDESADKAHEGGNKGKERNSKHKNRHRGAKKSHPHQHKSRLKIEPDENMGMKEPIPQNDPPVAIKSHSSFHDDGEGPSAVTDVEQALPVPVKASKSVVVTPNNRERLAYFLTAKKPLVLLVVVVVVVAVVLGLSIPLAMRNNCSSWYCQVGSILVGERNGGAFGQSVDMTFDGMRIVVGDPENDGEGIGMDSGHVRVLEWTGKVWEQVGNDIDGVSKPEYTGMSVAFSSDGNRIVEGAPLAGSYFGGRVRIHEWSKSVAQWRTIESQRGGDIEDYLGYEVAMSSDGKRVAACQYTQVTIWNFEAGPIGLGLGLGFGFKAIGSIPLNTDNSRQFVGSISMSSDGSRIIVGNPTEDSESGRVYVYSLEGNGYQLHGSVIQGLSSYDYFGESVDIDSSGTRIVVGAPGPGSWSTNRDESFPGYVQTFDWNGNDWQRVENDLVGATPGERFGFSVALSSDGSHMVVGSPGADARKSPGLVRWFNWNVIKWDELGSGITGKSKGGNFGHAVAINSNGNRIVVGAPNYDHGVVSGDGNTWTYGFVQVFDLKEGAQ